MTISHIIALNKEDVTKDTQLNNSTEIFENKMLKDREQTQR